MKLDSPSTDKVARKTSAPEQRSDESAKVCDAGGGGLENDNNSLLKKCTVLKHPKLQKVILLEKLTRWEVMCQQVPSKEVTDRMKLLFPRMFETYLSHTVAINTILGLLRQVHKLNVDAIISAGGDGTFLEGASLINRTDLFCPLGELKPEDPSPMVENNILSTHCSTAETPSPRLVWVFGINTDRSRSEGNLLMKRHHPPPPSPSHNKGGHLDNDMEANLSPSRAVDDAPESVRSDGSVVHPNEVVEDLKNVIDRIVTGNYTPLRRRRIRVSIADPGLQQDDTSAAAVSLRRPPGVLLRSNSINRRSDFPDVTELDELSHHHHRERGDTYPRKQGSFPPECSDIIPDSPRATVSSLSSPPRSIGHIIRGKRRASLSFSFKQSSKQQPHLQLPRQFSPQRSQLSNAFESLRVLEYRAVNDVLMTSRNSHMTTYVEISVDGGPVERSKNSGVVVCTGSGSSAWAYNVSKISPSIVEQVIEQYHSSRHQDKHEILEPFDADLICKKVNEALLFDPGDLRMRLVVREPIDNRQAGFWDT